MHTCRIRRAEIRYATAYSTWDYHVASDNRSMLAVCVAPLDVSRESGRENCRWTRKEGPGRGRVVASELKRNVDRK